MRIFAILFALSLEAGTPRVAPPDSARQQQTLESIKQFAWTHLDSHVDISCTQAPFSGIAKTITMEFSGPHPGVVSSLDTASLVQDVFAVSSGTQFEWDHRGTLAGKTLAVYRYSYQVNGKTHAGSIYADEDTGAISRIVFRGADTPAHLFCSAQAR